MAEVPNGNFACRSKGPRRRVPVPRPTERDLARGSEELRVARDIRGAGPRREATREDGRSGVDVKGLDFAVKEEGCVSGRTCKRQGGLRKGCSHVATAHSDHSVRGVNYLSVDGGNCVLEFRWRKDGHCWCTD